MIQTSLQRVRARIQWVRGRLHKDVKSRSTDLRVRPDKAGLLIWIGRFLLMLSAISLITAPLTQHLWTWDHFLHGGQDFELAVLMILTVLCMVLVISRHCKGCVDSLLAQLRVVERQPRQAALCGNRLQRIESSSRREPVTGLTSGIYHIPLQI